MRAVSIPVSNARTAKISLAGTKEEFVGLPLVWVDSSFMVQRPLGLQVQHSLIFTSAQQGVHPRRLPTGSVLEPRSESRWAS